MADKESRAFSIPEKIKELPGRIKDFLKRNDGKWQKYVIIALAVIAISAVTITVVVLKAAAAPVIAPEFAPMETDEKAEKLSDTDAEKLDHEEGGGAVSLTYSNEVSVDLESGNIRLFFQNPSQSTQDIVLQLVLVSGENEVVIAQSDKLPSGYMLQSLTLLDTAKLSAGGYNGRFNVLFYDPETGERAIVNTNIPVTINVK